MMFLPMQKKEAFKLYFLRSSKTKGVAMGWGPSSKVR
jgi:hypothetical protein